MASAGDCGGDQSGQHDARGAEEQQQHLGVERVVPHTVESRSEIVCERRAPRNSRLEIVRYLMRRLKGADGVSRQSGAIKKDMQLCPNGFGFRGPLRIEEGAPRRYREDQDVVGRRLRCKAGSQANRLKERVDIRDCRDAGHSHRRRGETGPIDANLIAHARMQVRGRLAVQNRSIKAAAQKCDLVGKSREIIRRDADRLARAGHLLRIAGGRSEAVDLSVLDRSHQLCDAGLVQRCLRRAPVDSRRQLNLPIDRHVGDGPRRHGVGR